MSRLGISLVAGGLLWAAPLAAQIGDRAEAMAAAVERELAGSRHYADVPRSTILLDTLRVDVPTREAVLVARRLGLEPGRSEDHCRRFLLDGYEDWRRLGPRSGVEVRGVKAIVTAWLHDFTPDSGYVGVSVVSGAGQHLNGPTSYVVRRDSAQWQAEYQLSSSSGLCDPLLFTAPLALAAQTMLDGLDADGPICFDPTGFLLLEGDSVAAALGARVHGQWVPDIGTETPEPYRDPCEKAGEDWGSVVRFRLVEWETDELIRVTVEGRVPADGVRRSARYTLRKKDEEWSIEEGPRCVPPTGAGGGDVPMDGLAGEYRLVVVGSTGEGAGKRVEGELVLWPRSH